MSSAKWRSFCPGLNVLRLIVMPSGPIILCDAIIILNQILTIGTL